MPCTSWFVLADRSYFTFGVGRSNGVICGDAGGPIVPQEGTINCCVIVFPGSRVYQIRRTGQAPFCQCTLIYIHDYIYISLFSFQRVGAPCAESLLPVIGPSQPEGPGSSFIDYGSYANLVYMRRSCGSHRSHLARTYADHFRSCQSETRLTQTRTLGRVLADEPPADDQRKKVVPIQNAGVSYLYPVLSFFDMS